MGARVAEERAPGTRGCARHLTEARGACLVTFHTQESRKHRLKLVKPVQELFRVIMAMRVEESLQVTL